MNISTRAKALVGVVALGGAAVAMGGAFTAGGISGTAHETPAFIGGSVDQSITGATISSIVHDVDEANNKINSVTLTFGDATADGKVPVITFTGATENGAYTCVAVDATSNQSLCSPNATTPVKADTNVTSVDITVSA